MFRMLLHQIKIVFRKEIKELLRDRRTIFVMVILPIILYPLLMIGISQITLMQMKRIEARTYSMRLAGREGKELIRRFTLDPQFQIDYVEDDSFPSDSSFLGDCDVALVVEDGFDEQLLSGLSGKIRIVFDRADDISEAAERRVEEIIGSFEDSLLSERLRKRALPEGFAKPIALKKTNVAPSGKMGAYLFGGILVFILIIMVINGAYYPSIDLIAGEKERGTLETVLVSPVSRGSVVLGKYLAVFSISVATAILNLGSMGLTFSYMAGSLSGVENVNFSISGGNIILILLMLLPLSGLFSAVFLAISSFAQSYKEGQHYLTPVFIVGELPAFAALVPGLKSSVASSFVPVMNIALVFKGMLLGEGNWLHLAIAFLSSLLYAAVMIKLSVSLLQKEEVLVGTGKPFAFLLHTRKLPDILDSTLLVIFSLLLLVFVGAPLQAKNIFNGLLITELILVLLPIILAIRVFKIDARDRLMLNPPTVSDTIFTLIVALGAWIAVSGWQALQSHFLPMPDLYIDQMEKLISTSGTRPLLYLVAMLGVLPGICEEYLFRGYMLSGYRQRLSNTGAIFLVAVAFGAFHLDPYRFVGATALGAILGFIAVRGNSLYLPMLAHIANNSLGVIAANIGLFEEGVPWYLALAGLPVVFFGLKLIGSRREKGCMPPDAQESGSISSRQEDSER